MLLSILCIGLSLAFLFAYLWRQRKKLFCFTLEATLLEVGEGSIEVKQQYYTLRHYFPKLTYEYSVEGTYYTCSTSTYDIRRYMVQEIDNFGTKRKDKDYFWRSLVEKSRVPIYVKRRDHSVSIVAFPERTAYRSENMVFAVMSALFLLVSIFLF